MPVSIMTTPTPTTPEVTAADAPKLPLDTAAAVAVVIVNHNGGDKLLKTIAAIADQPHAVEQVIVVDSASDDGSPDRAAERYPQANVIKLEDNVGPCVTRNTGVDQCNAPCVLLLDSDVYVQADTIAGMLAAYQETQAAVICPRIVLLPERDIQCEGATNHFLGTSGMRNGWMPIDKVEPQRAFVDGAISAALLVERAFYQAVGGFDAFLYFYYEDLEFGLRTRALGRTIVCEPNAVVLHDRGTGTAGLSYRGKGGYPRRRMFLQLRNRPRARLDLLPAADAFAPVARARAVRVRQPRRGLRERRRRRLVPGLARRLQDAP